MPRKAYGTCYAHLGRERRVEDMSKHQHVFIPMKSPLLAAHVPVGDCLVTVYKSKQCAMTASSSHCLIRVMYTARVQLVHTSNIMSGIATYSLQLNPKHVTHANT